MKGVRKGQLVIVDWLDATAHETGWNDSPVNHAEKARSVGIVTDVSHNAITLAADYDPRAKHRSHVNRAFTIPMGMVTRIRTAPPYGQWQVAL